jgi:hypothetical protein
LFALSCLSLVVAVVTLLAGFDANGLSLIYVSIGASVAAMLLVLATFLRPGPGR